VRHLLASLVVLTASTALAGPSEAVAAMAADLSRQPAETRPYLRYLWEPRPGDDRYKDRLYHLNELSTEADFAVLARVGADLYRFDTRDVGWDDSKHTRSQRAAYERLAEADPYFHVQLTTTTEETERYGKQRADGSWYDVEDRKTGKKTTKTQAASAPHLPTVEITYAIQQTQSQCPILRADWWQWYTSIQANRKAGYYDFLGVKNRDDFFELVGADLKSVARKKREVAAIVRKNSSGIAQNGRQLFREDGGVWFTKDVFDESKGRKNEINALDKDFDHDVERHLALLPNDIIGMLLCDKNGVRQDSAPDKVGPDSSATGNDGRIHVGLCLRCHRGNFLPIKDFARVLFSGETPLQAIDYEDLKRKRSLYLREYEPLLRADQLRQATALATLTGWKPAELADAIRREWSEYGEHDVPIEEAAADLGTTKEKLLLNLQLAAKQKGGVPPSLAMYLKRDPKTQAPTPIPMPRDYYEESFSQLAAVAKGYQP
jgi:hypothetical protein